jgi:hypothetical protein
MSDHGEPDAAEWSPEEQAAGIMSDVEDLARHGHVAQATARAASLPPLGPHPLSPMLERLSADGYAEEAAIIELGWREPIVLHQLRVAQRAGWIAAVVTFLVFLWPARVFAAIPAMAARLLVSELSLQLSGWRVLQSVAPHDRRRARSLYDLSIYRTRGTNRLGGADAVMLTIGGASLYAGALWARTSSASPWFVWAMTVSGTLMAFAGGFAVAATRRMARSGVKAPKVLKQLPPAPIERPPTLPIAHALAFRRPRIGRSLLLPAFLVIVGAPTVMEATPLWIVVGGACLAGAAWLIRQAIRSAVVIGPEGVRDIGVFRTRDWTWDEIHEIRVVTARDQDRNQSVRMITGGGGDHLLVANAGRHGANPELLRLCDSMNALATAPNPGPTTRATRSRLIGLAVLAFFIVVFGLFAAGALFGTGSTGINPADVPPGRVYTYYVRADRSLSPAIIECPSLASHLGGTMDPLCDGSYDKSSIAVVILLAIELGLLVGTLLVGRSYRRLIRERRAVRGEALALLMGRDDAGSFR